MGKLGAKLLRRWSSLRLGRPRTTMAKEEEEEEKQEQEKEKNVRRPSGLVAMDEHDYDESAKVQVQVQLQVPQGFTMVYVGKCRRRFLIKSQYVQHPLLAQLTQQQQQQQPHNDDDSDGDAVLLSCEVVLFQYLVWMLETSDPQSESLQQPDFAHLYASD